MIIKNTKKMKIFLILFFCLLSKLILAETLDCKVVGVSDGDTVKALCENNRLIRVRLSNIDAPEKKQAFGTKSKESVSDLCFGKQVKINDLGTDKNMIERLGFYFAMV